jgi:hypothetical protein
MLENVEMRGTMDTVADFILNIMEAETARTAIRVICGICAVIVCVWLAVFIYGRASAQNELRGWEETTATIKDSSITAERLEQASRDLSSFESVGGDAVGTDWYKVYTVSYMFTAESYAWGGSFVFENGGANTGKASEYAVEPPQYAFNIPKEGDVISIIYDPANKGSYMLGTLSDWRETDKLSLSDFLVPVVFMALGFVLIMLDFRIKQGAVAS